MEGGREKERKEGRKKEKKERKIRIGISFSYLSL